VVDLGPDGLVVIALVSTVNFALRTPAEQDGLVAGFARYLHALGGPVQILIRALPVDLHTHLQQLRVQAAHLPHPALAAAAHQHLTHLARLAQQDGDNQLLTRHVLLVLREPHRPATRAAAADPRPPARSEPAGREPGGSAGEHRLLRRLHDATTLLAAIDVSVTVLDAAHTTAVLTATCNPDPLNTRGRAADRVVGGSTRHLDNHDNHDIAADPLITGLGRGRTRNDQTGNDRHDGYRAYHTAGRAQDHDAHGDPIHDDSVDGYSDDYADDYADDYSDDVDGEADDDFDEDFDDEAVRNVRNVRAEAELDDAGSDVTSWTTRPSPVAGPGPAGRWTR
jgi:hypothetical protein